ncbi:MAG: nucleotidyltransferase domain-containing protein [Myxococcales bacterium]|nr:nucleotidyltransferase domain-containing protein [Myxococcales bacterium]MCB9630031.1 nucleotidyltransferase domain-containing protein [Sandaracinaceae bacterium]
MFELAEHTIFLTLAGSQAHGTAREGSDVDVRGVCVAPLRERLSLFNRFEQYEGALPAALTGAVAAHVRGHPSAEAGAQRKTECAIFELAKFVSLCAAANPSALEILFSDERDWVVATPAWRTLHDARHMFLTRRVGQTFVGYALAQLKRIETHRAWLINPPTHEPSRAEFPGDKPYRAAQKRWAQYQSWKEHRNEARAALERDHGYDTKHAMHLVRLLRMGAEALETGDLRVRRADADELCAIRDGALSFTELRAVADALASRMEDTAARSTLPDDIDPAAVDALALPLMLS